MIDHDITQPNIPVPAGWVVITETHPGTFDQRFFEIEAAAMDFADEENSRQEVAFVFVGEIKRVKGRPRPAPWQPGGKPLLTRGEAQRALAQLAEDDE